MNSRPQAGMLGVVIVSLQQKLARFLIQCRLRIRVDEETFDGLCETSLVNSSAKNENQRQARESDGCDVQAGYDLYQGPPSSPS